MTGQLSDSYVVTRSKMMEEDPHGVRATTVIPSMAMCHGGVSKSVKGLCEACADEGLRQSLVTTQCAEGEAEYCVSAELVDVTRVPSYKFQTWRFAWAPWFERELLRHVQSAQVNVIHSHGIWTQASHAASRLSRKRRIPLVISPHGMLATWALRHKAWKKLPAWWLYQRSDLAGAQVFRATATSEAASIRSSGFSQPIALIPNGIDVPDLLAPAPSRAGRGRRTVLFIGRIYPVKGLLNLVQAWAKIRPVGWSCVIAGPDESGHKFEVETALRSSGLLAEFSFPGPVYGEAKMELYRSADVFVLPSFTENFGLVVPEALSYTVPVITTHGTPWESLHKHGCGWWVPIGVEPLARALHEAMTMPDARRHEMGLCGQRFVIREFAWSTIGKRMIEVYRWACGVGSRPDCILT